MVVSRGGLIALLAALVLGAGFLVTRIDLRETDPMILAGGVLAVIVVGAIAAFAVEGVLEMIDRTYAHGRGVHEAWAHMSGRDVLLYSTTDALIFGKMYRALQRAIEQSE